MKLQPWRFDPSFVKRALELFDSWVKETLEMNGDRITESGEKFETFLRDNGLTERQHEEVFLGWLRDDEFGEVDFEDADRIKKFKKWFSKKYEFKKL